MYAAAAGASLGSRQARKKQRLQNTKDAEILRQTLKDKLAASKELHAPTKSRPFHQLPANYLRTPAGHSAAAGRKPSFCGHQSASNSRLLLPITETSSVASSTKNIHQLDQHLLLHYRSGHLKSPHHSRHASFNHKSRSHLSGSCSGSSRAPPKHSSNKLHHHHHHHQKPQQPHYHLNLNPDCAIHGSCSQLLPPNQRLNRSATATLPLNNLQTPPSTPLSRHPKHHDPSSAHLLSPLLGGPQTHHHHHHHLQHHHAQHRNSFSTLQLATLQPLEIDAGGPLSRRTSEADCRRASALHPMESIIITPATPLPSPHKQQLLNGEQQEGQEEEVENENEDLEAEGAAGGGGAEGEGALLIDLRPSAAVASSSTMHVNKSTDNLSRCESPIEPPQLERKCSIYRARPGPEHKYYYYDDESKMNEDDHYDSYGRAIKYELDPNAVHGEPCSYDLMVPAAGGEHGNSWISPEYGDANGVGRKHSTVICTCDHIECAQGKAAWLERGRRCSVQDQNAASCHRRWVKRNRIHDSSLGGSSDEDDFLGVLRGPSSFANAFLYVGLGTVAIGLIISFVGTGEKGFKTVELRLIGPSLIGIGLICCILRILFCICPSNCIKKRKKKKTNKVDADYTTSLLRSDQSTSNNSRGGGSSIKRVQIARGPNSMQKFPTTHSSHRLMKTNSKTMEGMEALRQIAATSLLMQGGSVDSEQQQQLQMQQSSSTSSTVKHQAFTRSSTSSSLRKGKNRVVPIIKEPESILDDQENVKRLAAMSVDIFNLSDGDDEDEEDDLEENSSSIRSPEEDSKASVIHRIIEPGPSNQAAMHQQQQPGTSREATIVTTLRTVNEKKNHTEIEPGGGGGSEVVRTIMTTVAEVTSGNSSNNGSGSSRTTTAETKGSFTVETHGVNKLSRDRAPVNLGTIAKRPSAGLFAPSSSTNSKPSGRGFHLTTQATPTTLLDAVLIETSLCEPISPSFTINLPSVGPMSPPPANFSISDNKHEPSSSSAFPFPPNFFAIPGSSSSYYNSSSAAANNTSTTGVYPLTSMKPPAPTQEQQRNSSMNKFSYQLPGAATSRSNNSRSGGSGASAGELELVLSPAKLGQ